LGLKNFGFGVSEKVWGLKFWFWRQRKSLGLKNFGFIVSEKVGA